MGETKNATLEELLSLIDKLGNEEREKLLIFALGVKAGANMQQSA